MTDPQGLYWLGPLAWSFTVALGCLAMVVAVWVVIDPRARRNRTKLRARRLLAEARLRDAMTEMQVQVGDALLPSLTAAVAVVADAMPRVAAMRSVLDELELHGQLSEADRPHVLVASWTGGIGPASGPYEDLWQATAAAPGWEASLNDVGDDERNNPVFVTVMPMYAPGT